MKKILNLKFKKGIQRKLNDFFYDEKYHAYTLGEVLMITAANIVVLGLIILGSIAV